MDRGALRELIRLVTRDPEDPEAWDRTLRMAARWGRELPEALEPLNRPERLLRLWRALPQARSLTALLPGALGVELWRGPASVPGSFWEETGRLGRGEDHAWDRVTGLPLAVWRPQDGAEMRLVPAGAAVLGAESARQVVEVGAFYLDRFPLDRGRFGSFLVHCRDEEAVAVALEDFRATARRLGPGHARLPAAPIRGPLAEAYAAWVGSRLPTSMEWEKAGRGTQGEALPWGRRATDASRANFDPFHPARRYPRSPRAPDRAADYLRPVGSYPAGRSPFGVEEMAGGVLEWTHAGFPERGWRELYGSAWIHRLDELHLARCHHPVAGALPPELLDRVDPRDQPLGLRLARSLPGA